MSSDAVSSDELKTIKQLIAGAASYAESASKRSDQNALMIQELGEKMDQTFTEMKQAQDRTQQQLNKLGQKQDRTQQTLDALDRRVDSFVFESQRLILGHADRIQKLEDISERLEGILSYLVRKENQKE